MSAYGNSDAIREAQVNKLCGDMQAEYEKGNYVICGGDFNHDLKASEDTEEDRASWAYPFPRSDLPEGFSFSMDFLGEAGKAALPDSARNADMPYEEGVTYTVTLDGFIISDNIEPVSYTHLSWDKKYEKELNMFPVLWDVDPLDWCSTNVDKIVRSVLAGTKENSIILMHDSYDSRCV